MFSFSLFHPNLIIIADCSMSMSMREKKKKVHFTKVSEVDYKILILENRELLSLKEQEKLQSLKERKVLLESNGMVGLKSASFLLILLS